MLARTEVFAYLSDLGAANDIYSDGAVNEHREKRIDCIAWSHSSWAPRDKAQTFHSSYLYI